MKLLTLNKPTSVLFLLWLLATSLNLTKAFHIDDAFHLAAAQWIEHHPFRPMSGKVLWDFGYVPISQYNQPPLYFYFVSWVGHVLGYREVPLHLMQAVFTLLAIYFFYKIARLLIPAYALLSTAFLVLNPAFLINQNLMVDMPLLSLHLLFIYLLINPEFKSDWLRYGLAGFVLSLALLIKYTSLPLLVLFSIHLVLNKKFKFLITVLIPVGVLALWSLANYYEFNSFHLFRPTAGFNLRHVGSQLLAYVLTLGAIVPFSLVYVAGYFKERRRLVASAVGLTISFLVLLILITYTGWITEKISRKALWVLHLLNGVTFLFLIIRGCLQNLNFKNLKKFLTSSSGLLILWAAGMAGFIILFAPFMATRHVLLVLPVFLIFGAKWLAYASQKIKIITLLFTTCLSLILGISDWFFADLYRQEAATARNKIKSNAVVWTVGYWGWHWYSQQAGMQPYVASQSQPNQNDYFVIPANLPHQEFKQKNKLRLIEQKIIYRNFISFFAGSNIPGLYSTDRKNTSWKLTHLPLDTIQIYQVRESF
ncbi:glycosyltransferase family 39 protein [Adhaeribacter swui]|uniref:Glycosyltransferase family 39 protein n=1 Tax=Adhaeribacter swui TaxID=2086471 RepID=A0A7G7GCH8_9BACT|nr:glycosyltransferase family 39 protein [Adhaeribacter swui]QNF34862.1 glycosyltransferase family 39 protein [Adhaeribacter swui]